MTCHCIDVQRSEVMVGLALKAASAGRCLRGHPLSLRGHVTTVKARLCNRSLIKWVLIKMKRFSVSLENVRVPVVTEASAPNRVRARSSCSSGAFAHQNCGGFQFKYFPPDPPGC